MFWQILNSLEFLRNRGKNSKVSSTHLKRHATCLWFTFECFYFCLISKNRGQTEVNFFAIFTVKIVIFVFIYVVMVYLKPILEKYKKFPILYRTRFCHNFLRFPKLRPYASQQQFTSIEEKTCCTWHLKSWIACYKNSNERRVAKLHSLGWHNLLHHNWFHTMISSIGRISTLGILFNEISKFYFGKYKYLA